MFFSQNEVVEDRSVDLDVVTCKKMLKIDQNGIPSLALPGDEKMRF